MEIVEHSENNTKFKKNNTFKYIIIVLVIMLAFFLGAGLVYWYGHNDSKVITESRTISETKVTEEAMEDAIDMVYDSVLCIEVMNGSETLISTGTGFVYKKDDKYGYVLTNSHVVSNGTIIRGVLSNDQTVDLTLLGTDTYMDIAVLRMDASNVLKVATIGTSENIRIGNTVFTVGSPMGLNYAGTVTKGILSGENRLIETTSSNGLTNENYIVRVVQTDAAISPGNSGGPLVDLSGTVIGITSLKLVNEKVEGMGFALPMEDVMNYVDTLEKKETIKRPLLGIQIIDLTNRYLLQRYDVKVPTNITDGVVLMKVNSGYPAADAGLKDNDIITEVDGKKIKTVAEFKYQLYRKKIGEEVEVTYVRDNKTFKCKVKLDKTN